MATKVTFEDAMTRLEEIVRRLEEEKVPLEESIKLYEEGMKIGKKCRKILDDADHRIRELSGKLEEDAGSE
jgi:exodeoxyribonuclease VII small subunit